MKEGRNYQSVVGQLYFDFFKNEGRKERIEYRRMNGEMDGWMDKLVGEWMDEWMDLGCDGLPQWAASCQHLTARLGLMLVLI